MPGSRETPARVIFTPAVLKEIDKENIQSSSALRARTPDKRNKLGAIKLFHDENAMLGAASPDPPGTLQLGDALNQAEAQVARYREERRQAVAALKQRNERVLDLKATAASANERYAALLKSHEEANKELGLLRAQLATSSSSVGNIERLKMTAESLETNNELLREERASLAALLAKREAACAAVKDELSAITQSEQRLREELDSARAELDEVKCVNKEKNRLQPEADSQGKVEWVIQKAGLEAQVKELAEQLAVAGRRCASVAAERAAAVEESARQSREHETTVAALQQELQSLHRRTSAELGDWQRRHREAVAARKAMGGQLERLVAAGRSIAAVNEQQAALERSMREACELLDRKLEVAMPRGETAGIEREGTRAREDGVDEPGRAVEGILEHVLGRVFEATQGGEHTREKGDMTDEEAKDREAEHELRREALAALGQTFEKLTAEMATLRESGEMEANAYLEHERQRETELEEERERHRKEVSELELARAASAKEVDQLVKRVAQCEKERAELEMQMEATVQLSEMALASRANGNGGRDDANRRETEATREDKIGARNEVLEGERRAFEERVETLERENKMLHGRLEELAVRSSPPKAESCPRETLMGEHAANEERECSQHAEKRSVDAKDREVAVEELVGGSRSPGDGGERGDRDAHLRVEALQAEVERLKDVADAEKARAERIKSKEHAMRQYLLDYHKRGEQKIKDLQHKLARATAVASGGQGHPHGV